MANIQISELRTNGFELFSDAESYMKELSQDDIELVNIQGGATPLIVTAIYTVCAISSAQAGWAISKALAQANQ